MSTKLVLPNQAAARSCARPHVAMHEPSLRSESVAASGPWSLNLTITAIDGFTATKYDRQRSPGGFALT